MVVTKITKTLLINPKHSYGKKQVYMPSSLYSVASRLMDLGVEATVLDLNIDELPDISRFQENKFQEFDLVGITVFGSAYVPCALNIISDIRKKSNVPIIVGGQLADKLADDQFDRIFKKDYKRITKGNDSELEKMLGIGSTMTSFPGRELVFLPNRYATALAPALANVKQNALKLYLENEFSFFLSNGCMYGCGFCPADKQQSEKYRTKEVILEDLVFLSENARKNGIKELKMYLSSLDLFQNPKLLSESLQLFAAVQKEYGVTLHLRALSRVDSFLNAMHDYPQLKKASHEAGLEMVAFGVDGTTEQIWKAQHKSQKKLSDVDSALSLCKDLQIKPEMLMVMGFPQDTFYTLLHNYFYTISRAIEYGAVSRPYLAKSFAPGNEGWNDPKKKEIFADQIEQIIQNPELFYNLDFAAFGSRLTHPNNYNRFISNLFYGALIATLEPFGCNTTYPLFPYRQEDGVLSKVYNMAAKKLNSLLPVDR